jgi:hypothetical protein
MTDDSSNKSNQCKDRQLEQQLYLLDVLLSAIQQLTIFIKIKLKSPTPNQFIINYILLYIPMNSE